MRDIPVLHTERLVLRPHRLSDFDDCLTLWTHPDTVRFINGGVPQDEQTVWFRILRHAGLWALFGYGSWVFEDRETGAYLGEGGLLESRRGIPALTGAPELGWAVAPQAAGQGIATEAICAVLGWVDTARAIPKTRCIIDIGNVASVRVATKCGFHEIARIDDRGTALFVLERPRA